MTIFTDTTYYLDDRERLQVVKFATAHLPALRQAVAHLEAVAAQQAAAADEDPFPGAA